MRALPGILLCLMLLVSQYAVATHVYEHDIHHDSGEDCVTCLKHANNKLAITDSPILLPCFTAADEAPVEKTVSIHSRPTSLPQNRSPPAA